MDVSRSEVPHRVYSEMSNIAVVICSDDLPVVVDLASIQSTCPPVLARFLGTVDGFSDPPKDTQGRLTFAKEFGIDQTAFTNIITFVRSGHTQDMNALVRTFTILGGSDALYKAAEQDRQKEQDRVKQLLDESERAKQNPLCPEDNFFGLYRFEPHPASWVHEGCWECCSKIDGTIYFWWRTPVLPDLDDAFMSDVDYLDTLDGD